MAAGRQAEERRVMKGAEVVAGVRSRDQASVRLEADIVSIYGFEAGQLGVDISGSGCFTIAGAEWG